MGDNLALVIRPSVVLLQDRQIMPANPLGQTLLACKACTPEADSLACKHPQDR